MTWEDQAENWTTWARTPGHDVFPRYIDAFLDDIAPPPSGRTLEAGCGEGRVVRKLIARGHRVTGIDASPTLVRHARALDASASYAIADATRLPFADASFDTVVAYNALQAMHAFDDMARAVAEAARVLAPRGALCVCVAHPITDIGLMTHRDGELVASGSYFDRRRVDETVEKDGLAMTFRGWTYTIEDYARAFEAAGLRIDRLREPPAPAAPAPDVRDDTWRRLPLFLFLRGVKSVGR
jgi:SAM-dependent methyltransferase